MTPFHNSLFVLSLPACFAALFLVGCTTAPPTSDRDLAEIPIAEEEPLPEGFLSLGVGFSHGCALHSSGQILCWGNNGRGQLGTGDQVDQLTPTLVLGIDDAIAIAVGGAHTCALHRSGEVSCWGAAQRTGHAFPDGIAPSSQTTPVKVQAPGGMILQNHQSQSWCPADDILRDIVALDAGTRHTCAVHANGNVLCWGANNLSQSGAAAKLHTSLPCPLPVEGISDAKSVFAGHQKTCAITDQDEILCWGGDRTTPYNWREFTVGLGSNRWTEMAIAPHLRGAEEIRLGDSMPCARWPDGSTRCFRENSDSEREEFLPSEDQLLASSTGFRTCFLDGESEMTCHSHHQPGDYSFPQWNQESPLRELTAPSESDHSIMAPVCAISEDHRLFCTMVYTAHKLPARGDWTEVSFQPLDFADLPAPSDTLSSQSPQEECPQDLVFGNPEWPNHIRFERGGMTRTIYFEEILAEFQAPPGADFLNLAISFPSLRFDTASGEAPRTDGWDQAYLSAPVEAPEQPLAMHFSYDNIRPKLGCFSIPPNRFGTLTFSQVEIPSPEQPTRGSVAGSFETTIGGSETGKMSGAFSTENVFRDIFLDVDPEKNISLGYSSPASAPDNEELVGAIGRAIYREDDDYLLLQFGKEGLIHGRGFGGFTGEPGVYLGPISNTYRFRIEAIEEDRISGSMDTFTDLSRQPFFFLQELKSPEMEPNSPVSMEFDLPLFRLRQPAPVHLRDQEAPLRIAQLAPSPDALAKLQGEELLFHVYPNRGVLDDPDLEEIPSFSFSFSLLNDDGQPRWRRQDGDHTIEAALDPDTLALLSASEVIESSHGPMEVLTELSLQKEEGFLRLRAHENPNQTEGGAELAASDLIYDQRQLLSLLPLLPLEAGTLFHFDLFELITTPLTMRNEARERILTHRFVPHVHPVELSVQGVETIEIWGEEIQTRRVQLTYRAQPHRRWIFYLSQDEPHRIKAVVDDQNRWLLPAE